MRAPRHGLDSRAMFAKPPRRSVLGPVPNEHLVVIPATRELVRVDVPFETADLLFVLIGKFPDILLGHTHVAVKDGPVSRSGRQDVVIPCQTSYSVRVAR